MALVGSPNWKWLIIGLVIGWLVLGGGFASIAAVGRGR